MTEYILRDNEGNESEPFPSREKALQQQIELPKDVEIIEVDSTATDGGTQAVEAKPVPDTPEQAQPDTVDTDTREIVERVDAPDPNSTLPHWMLTEIEHSKGDVSVDLNKRGVQVVSNHLDLVVNAECEVPAKDTDFEYCRYRATAQMPDGDEFTAVGDAHIDEQGKNKWDLERLAETRSKKRAAKWASAGGLAAFDGDTND